MREGGKINFQPVMNPKEADFMLIIGRPFVEFWEPRTIPRLIKNRKSPIAVWDVSLDSVPLIKLYLISEKKDERKDNTD